MIANVSLVHAEAAQPVVDGPQLIRKNVMEETRTTRLLKQENVAELVKRFGGKAAPVTKGKPGIAALIKRFDGKDATSPVIKSFKSKASTAKDKSAISPVIKHFENNAATGAAKKRTARHFKSKAAPVRVLTSKKKEMPSTLV